MPSTDLRVSSAELPLTGLVRGQCPHADLVDFTFYHFEEVPGSQKSEHLYWKTVLPSSLQLRLGDSGS